MSEQMSDQSSCAPAIRMLSEHLEASRAKLLDAVGGLGRETFLARRPGGASVRDLLVHLMEAEDYWVTSVILGRKRDKFLPGNYEDVAALRSAWEEVHGRTRGLFAGLTRDLLAEARTVVWDEERTFGVGTILWHFFLHESHHRGQICMMMRDGGHTPPELDVL
ncbi:MAG: DinB family protein [Candidatus Eisenbacteria bacterium]